MTTEARERAEIFPCRPADRPRDGLPVAGRKPHLWQHAGPDSGNLQKVIILVRY